MSILPCNSRRVDNLEVAVLVLALNLLGSWVDMGMIIAELQEPFQATTGMFRSLSVEAMGQIHNQTSALQPFPFARSNKLVNNDLGTIDEITKLSFPYGERIGGNKGITKFETESAILRQGRVTNDES